MTEPELRIQNSELLKSASPSWKKSFASLSMRTTDLHSSLSLQCPSQLHLSIFISFSIQKCFIYLHKTQRWKACPLSHVFCVGVRERSHISSLGESVLQLIHLCQEDFPLTLILLFSFAFYPLFSVGCTLQPFRIRCLSLPGLSAVVLLSCLFLSCNGQSSFLISTWQMLSPEDRGRGELQGNARKESEEEEEVQ